MKKIIVTKDVLIQKLNSGRNKEEIAIDLGISRPTLNNLIKNYAVENEYTYNCLLHSKRISCNITFF